jgi:putative spermidine/putrescine transport system permease protein
MAGGGATGTRSLGAWLRRRSWLLVLLPGIMTTGLLFVWPLAIMTIRSLTDPEVGISNYTKFFDTPSAVTSLVTTVRISAIVTVVTAVLGYTYAFTMLAAAPVTRRVLMTAVILPMAVSLLVRTFALQAILRDTGTINRALEALGLITDPLPLIRNQFSVSVGMVSMLLPFMVLPLYNTMTGIDERMLLAASGLGASPRRVFLDVFFPLSLPGLVAGCLVVFVSSLGFYVVPALLGGGSEQFLSQVIFDRVRRLGDFGYGSAIGVIMLVLTMLILGIAARFVKLDRVFGQTVGAR